MIHNLVIGTKITRLCFKWEFDSVIAVVNLFHENTAGKVGQKERIDIIEAQNPEFLELKDHLG